MPLIVRGPGVKGGVWCNEPVISYDLTATVLDFVSPGFELPKGMEGGSWKAVLLSGGIGKVKRPVDRFIWHQATEFADPHSAIRKGDFKVIYYWKTRVTELFNLAVDLRETRDLAKEKPELAKELQHELLEHIRVGLGQQAFAVLEKGEFPEPRAGKGKVKRQAN